MHFTTPLIALLSLTTTVSAATYNKKLQVRDIGRVPSVPGFPGLPVTSAGKCGGIPEGGWVCGSFGPGKNVALRAIYRCEKGKLKQKEICSQSSENNRCVKNQRKGGKRFYPFQAPEKIVCVKKDAKKA